MKWYRNTETGGVVYSEAHNRSRYWVSVDEMNDAPDTWEVNDGAPPPTTGSYRVLFRDGTFGSAALSNDWSLGGGGSDIVAYRPLLDEQPIQFALPPVDMSVPGYEQLAGVLQRAYNQAAKGKGAERHANGEPFDEQVMQDGARRFGVGALLFQAFKKSEESQRLPLERGVAELLGAIVYLAGAVIRREADAAEGGAK